MREKDYYGAIKGFCLKWNLPEVWNSDRITGANLIYEVIKVINAMINELREYEERVDGKLEEMLKMIEDFLKMFNEDLSETVLNILVEWKDSGILEDIINDALFNQKLDKSVFESFKETYDQTIENINETINNNKQDSDSKFILLNESLNDQGEDIKNLKPLLEKFTLPPLKLKMFLDMGNVYGQGMCIIPELDIVIVGTPKKDGYSTLYKYNWTTGSLLLSKKVDVGHAGSITYNSLKNVLVIANQEGTNKLSEVSPLTLEIVRSVDIGMNVGTISYDVENDSYVGSVSNGGDSTKSNLILIFLDSNYNIINQVNYEHPVTHETWWVQGGTIYKNTYLISYTNALDHDKAKHGESGVIQITFEGELLSDYVIDSSRNYYYEMESIQIIENNVYFGLISNNYEYSNGSVGYDILEGDMLKSTPNVSYLDLDGLEPHGVLHQVYYNESHTGKQLGTPLQPFNNLKDLFKNVKFDNFDIVLESDITKNYILPYYNSFNYVRISGNDKSVKVVLDFRGFNRLDIRKCVFDVSDYWGNLIFRKCDNVELSGCVFNGASSVGVSLFGGFTNITGCTFNTRSVVQVLQGASANVTSCTGSVNEISFLSGGTTYIKKGNLVSTKDSRDSLGQTYVK